MMGLLVKQREYISLSLHDEDVDDHTQCSAQGIDHWATSARCPAVKPLDLKPLREKVRNYPGPSTMICFGP